MKGDLLFVTSRSKVTERSRSKSPSCLKISLGDDENLSKLYENWNKILLNYQSSHVWTVLETRIHANQILFTTKPVYVGVGRSHDLKSARSYQKMAKNSPKCRKSGENKHILCHNVLNSWSIAMQLGRCIVCNDIYPPRLKKPCQGHFKVKGQGQILQFSMKYDQKPSLSCYTSWKTSSITVRFCM